MKILGISGSSRGDQQSGCHKLAETALEASECEYELVSLRGKTILGCTGCLGCVEDNVCVLKDDMSPLRAKFVEADAFVIAAPNYFSGMNASTHAMLERLYQFRHREADTLWGKLAVAIGVGGQGAACCFTCGYGETCKVGAIHMFFGPGTKITEEITPAVEKQPEVMQVAIDAGKELGRRLNEGHDRAEVAARMQQQMMEKYKKST
jgi:multimeric flavodoxin WrbA